MWKSILLMFIGLLIIGGTFAGAAIVTADQTGAATVPESGWQIDSFDAQYVTQTDGSIKVTETIDVDFNGLVKHGIYRVLVTKAKCVDLEGESAQLCPEGRRRLWDISGFSVADGNGRPLEVLKESKPKGVSYRIGDPDVTISGAQRYIITYTLDNAFNPVGADSAELYWNGTGEWTVPIIDASISVVLPKTDAQFEDLNCYFGRLGNDSQCLASSAGNTANFRAGRISSAEQVTISAIFPQDVIPEPEIVTQDIRTVSDFFRFSILEFVGTGIVGIITVAGVVFAWWRKGRDRRYTSVHYLTQTTEEEVQPLFAEKNIVVEFLPPNDMRPGEMGTLINEGASARDVSATVVDLAVRGYLIIEEDDKKKDWTFKKVREADDKLLTYERNLFNAIFAVGREEVKVSALKNTFAGSFAKAKKEMLDDAMAKHWFGRRPDHARAFWITIGFIITIVGSALSFVLGFFWHEAFIALPIAIAGVLMLGFASHMSRRTATGHEALRRTLGFELYVATAESRMQDFNEQQNIFARYLPYAIVFDCVDKWAKAFKGLENNPQAAGVSSWYYGGAAGFSAAAFSNSMNSFSSSVSSSFASTPGGSGSSGGGGGGFSGGGGGGGGGGSW